jgi:hypothetical protein
VPESNLPKREKKRFKSWPIGYFHIDIIEVPTEKGNIHLFIPVDHTSKFAYGELLEKAGKMETAQFLKNLIRTVP